MIPSHIGPETQEVSTSATGVRSGSRNEYLQPKRKWADNRNGSRYNGSTNGFTVRITKGLRTEKRKLY